VLTDSLVEPDFKMLSWYHSYKDTIDLVAYVGEFETQALLLRFIHRTPHVYYIRAPHEDQRYFRLKKTDTFTDHIEVPPVRYKLALSVIPDTIQKQLVFGTIDMMSGGYYDQRDTSRQERSVRLKCYFRSKYRSFN